MPSVTHSITNYLTQVLALRLIALSDVKMFISKFMNIFLENSVRIERKEIKEINLKSGKSVAIPIKCCREIVSTPVRTPNFSLWLGNQLILAR